MLLAAHLQSEVQREVARRKPEVFSRALRLLENPKAELTPHQRVYKELAIKTYRANVAQYTRLKLLVHRQFRWAGLDWRHLKIQMDELRVERKDMEQTLYRLQCTPVELKDHRRVVNSEVVYHDFQYLKGHTSFLRISESTIAGWLHGMGSLRAVNSYNWAEAAQRFSDYYHSLLPGQAA